MHNLRSHRGFGRNTAANPTPAAGGIRGGQAIGCIDNKGHEVTDRPISVADYMATVSHILGIDYKKEITTPTNDQSASLTRKSN